MTTQFQRFSEPNFLQNQQPESIVPIEGRRNILVCAALPYVNNVPHLGNIIGAVLSADVFVRYCRMREYQCLYICGTDEYGTATELRALTEGVSPKEICDKFHKLHKEVYDWFGIAFDCFGRTSSEHQTELVQDMFLKIYNNGFTSLDIQKQLHCSNCDKFLADRFVNGICPHCKFPDARGDQCDKCGKLLDGIELIDPKCLICGNEPLVRETEHIFLNLDQLTSKVQNYLDNVIKSPGSHWSTTAISITRSWMKTGLERRSITRDLKWGIPVPLKQFSSKVFYVWFDAVIGYLSITKSLLGPKWINWWKNPDNVELYNFLGKDNVPFHSIIFPACLAASGEIYTNPRHLCATEYLNYEGQKFSKSRGLGVFGDTVAEIGIPPDVLRFYLIYMRPEGQDTSFCWDDLVLKVNSELLANLGNFVNRALSFLSNFFSGIQPSIEISQIEEELFIRIDEDLKEFICAMENVRMRDALHTILSISRRGNQYMQAGKPWVLIKSDKKEDNLRAQTIIGVSANISLFISIMLQPFMPTTSAQIRYQCNIPSPMVLPEHFALFLKTGHKHNKPSPLFTKIETTKVKEWKALYDGDQDFKDVMVNGISKNKTTKNNKMTSGNNSSSFDINNLYNEVLTKFLHAKDIFVAKEMARLDEENKALNEETEELKVKLGYIGPLFVPPLNKSNDLPINTPHTNKSQLVYKNQETSTKYNVPTTKNNEDIVHKSKQSKKSESTQIVRTDGDRVGDEIDVGRLDFRVGRIIQAKKHPDADSLYVEEIDIGEDRPRTVVSGLVRFIPLEEMQDRLVVCLCNLKPAKMRGIESQAMVMCASTPEKVELLEIDPDCKPGDIIMCESFSHRPDLPFLNPKKKIWEAIAPELSVSATGECVYKGHQLRVFRNGSALKARTLINVPVK